MNIKIRYIDGLRLKRSIIASAHRITEMQEQLNAINVFPVADADTGTNMAATMRAIIESTQSCPEVSLAGVCRSIADGALQGARGNSGAILAQFFQGLAEACSDKDRLSVDDFAAAVRLAVERAREALSNPREGTILTVMEDWANFVSAQAGKESDYVLLLQDALQRARVSLAETPKKLKVLKKAGVVDAGAQGFVHLLEGLSDFIDSGKVAALKAGSHLAGRIRHFHFHRVKEEIRFRYCTECLLEGEGLQRQHLLDVLSPMGDSIIVVGGNRKMRIHIHTNEPDAVFALAEKTGHVLQTKVEDMMAQNENALAQEAKEAIALVTDSTCDLPDDVLRRFNVHVVPVKVFIGEKDYEDRVEISTQEIYRILKDNSARVSTSQPPVASYIKVYESVAKRFEAAISIHLSGGLSGTFDAAQTAAKSMAGKMAIELLDSKTASVGLGLLVAEAGRLIEKGVKLEEIVRLLKHAISQSRVFVCVPTMRYLMRSGRLTKSRGLLATLLNIKPVITLNDEGKIIEAAKVIGLQRVYEKTVELAGRFAASVRNPRFQIAHALTMERALWCKEKLLAQFPEKEIPIVDASPALGLHTGIGSIAVAVMGDPDNKLS
jgi:DAK2 domain fusion protein YloV